MESSTVHRLAFGQHEKSPYTGQSIVVSAAKAKLDAVRETYINVWLIPRPSVILEAVLAIGGCFLAWALAPLLMVSVFFLQKSSDTTLALVWIIQALLTMPLLFSGCFYSFGWVFKRALKLPDKPPSLVDRAIGILETPGHQKRQDIVYGLLDKQYAITWDLIWLFPDNLFERVEKIFKELSDDPSDSFKQLSENDQVRVLCLRVIHQFL